MNPNTNAEIIAIGTEILLGEITDTNSVFIAQQLRDIGVNLYYMTSVGDNIQRIADALRIAMGRAQIIITCGGLGPTVDDMTRDAVAVATDRGLVFHQHLLDEIARRFAGFRANMTENNRRQAYLPKDAILIENPVGTAPSFIVEIGDKSIISLPGVPREMKFLMNDRVIPYLKDRFELGTNIIKAKVLRTAGIGESLLDSRIGSALLEMSNPTVGLAAHAGQVDVRITAKAINEATADQMIHDVEVQIRQRIGEFIFGIDNDEIETALGQLLAENHLTLAVCETGVTDLLTQRISKPVTDTQVFIGSIKYYHPSELQAFLGTQDSDIRKLAEAAAERISKELGANAAIAVVSIPDMDEQHADQDAGTAMAVYCDGGVRSRVYGFGGQSEIAPQWASTWSMSMLWQMIHEKHNA